MDLYFTAISLLMYVVCYHAGIANIFQPLWTMTKNMFNPLYLESSLMLCQASLQVEYNHLEGHTKQSWGPLWPAYLRFPH